MQPLRSTEATEYTHQKPCRTLAQNPYRKLAPYECSPSETPDPLPVAYRERSYTAEYNPALIASPQGHQQGPWYGQPPSQSLQGMRGYNHYPPLEQAHPTPYPRLPGLQGGAANVAKAPLLIHQDDDGVQWMIFEHSKNVATEYTIRCDVESVNVGLVSADFKARNCVYPGAYNQDEYCGNRLKYETECNTVGWALTNLNPCLRGKRGAISKAVTNWRNNHQDARLHSGRVKRMEKLKFRHRQAEARRGRGRQVMTQEADWIWQSP